MIDLVAIWRRYHVQGEWIDVAPGANAGLPSSAACYCGDQFSLLPAGRLRQGTLAEGARFFVAGRDESSE